MQLLGKTPPRFLAVFEMLGNLDNTVFNLALINPSITTLSTPPLAYVSSKSTKLFLILCVLLLVTRCAISCAIKKVKR